MISVKDALARIVAAFAPLDSEIVTLENALGRVLADDAHAHLDQPPAPVSAMDGYAVRASDVSKPGVTLHVVGSAPAGHPFAGSISYGETVRIFTGGVVPDGANAIVIQENAVQSGDKVTFSEAAIAGRHVRKAGLDFARDAVLAGAGRRLRARDLSLLAAGDISSVRVRRKPVIVFAATGDELSKPGAPRKSGGIVASSGYGLAAMIETWGGVPRDLGILPDTVDALAELPARAQGADLIVTMGGASVGDHDLVRTALAPKGFVLDFWKIAMRPGKPLIFGQLGNTPFLGLPGNPVSSLVCSILFLKPALKAMLGEQVKNETRTARLAADVPANDSRQDYLRASLIFRDGAWWTEPYKMQDSSMQHVFVLADCLILRAPHAAPAAQGSEVEIIPLDEI
jgi:molybdopterin molybdotransferase